MYPHVHIYCAEKIAGRDPMLLYGSIFPDFAATGVIGWRELQEKTEGFSGFLDEKDSELSDFGVGLLLHEEPIGIDRFVHGDDGYAFVKGREILSEVEKLFPDKSLSVAHNFIEFAVEYLVVKKNKRLLGDMRAMLEKAGKKKEKIARAFSEYFEKDYRETLRAIEIFNEMAAMDLSSYKTAVAMQTKLTNILRKTEYLEGDMEPLVKLNLSVVEKDYESFIEETIGRCKIDYEKYIK